MSPTSLALCRQDRFLAMFDPIDVSIHEAPLHQMSLNLNYAIPIHTNPAIRTQASDPILTYLCSWLYNLSIKCHIINRLRNWSKHLLRPLQYTTHWHLLHCSQPQRAKQCFRRTSRPWHMPSPTHRTPTENRPRHPQKLLWSEMRFDLKCSGRSDTQ
jgi:hypothetical protein